ncbi:MAG: TolC family protein [Bacteroidales bacterium]|jgi:outer membrane protein TolC|nr:TolC family protein [Bacteroidales bacterium]
MRKIVILIFALFFCLSCYSQITIEYCQSKAKANYPTFSNTSLLEKSSAYSLANATRNYLPQINFFAKATYQSDVTKIDVTLPPPLTADFIKFPQMSKDQYQAALELSQVIWDGGYTYNKRKEIKAELEAQKANLEVELYTLRERIANLYFGILSIKEQKSLTILMQKELDRNIEQVNAFAETGLANESDLDLLKVEKLNLEQRIVEIELLEKSYINMLSLMMGEDLSNDTKFIEPELKSSNLSTTILRPELRAMDNQIKLLDAKKKMINAGSMPHLAAFAQGGYGKPALNMFNEDPDFFAIVGLRLSWNISSFYTKSNNAHQIDINKQLLESNRNTFLFNTNLQMEGQMTEIERLEKLLKSDREIIVLRERIKETSHFKMENGVMSVSDYIKEVNATDLAKQNEILHRIQLLMSIYKQKNLTNQSYEN